MSTQSLRPQHLVLPDSLSPVQVISVLLSLLPPTPTLHTADAKATSQTMTTTILGRHGSLQPLSPLETLLAVVGDAVVEGKVDLDHACARLEAELGGRGLRSVAGGVWVLKDEEAAAQREGGVYEDVVGGRDGVVFVIVVHGVCGC